MKKDNELIAIEEQSIQQAFEKAESLEFIIDDTRAVVEAFEHDLSTDAGRKRTASLARKVSSLKTRVDNVGKDLVSGWKAKAKTIDATRKYLREGLDALRDEARKPLNEWEAVEAERIERIQAAITLLQELSVCHDDNGIRPLATLEQQLESAQLVTVDGSFGEFELQADKQKRSAISALLSAIAAEKKNAEQAAELERLQKAEAERLEKEAADKAEAERVEREKQHQAELERQRIAAEEKAEADRIAAEERAKEQAEEAAEKARQDEIDRQEREQAEAEAAQKKREANKRLVNKVNKQVVASLERFVDTNTAEGIVKAIAAGEIANVHITY